MSNLERSSTWDPDAFEQQLGGAKWRDAEEKKAATRLQDLSLGLDGAAAPSASQNKTWPFEEPCAWHGGKNTRKGGEDINKEIFDSDFKADSPLRYNEDERMAGSDDDSSDSSSTENGGDASGSSSIQDSDEDSFGADDDVMDTDEPKVSHDKPMLERRGSQQRAKTQDRAEETVYEFENEDPQPTRRFSSVSSADRPGPSKPRRRSSLGGGELGDDPSQYGPTNDYNKMLAWNRMGESDRSLPSSDAPDDSSFAYRRNQNRRGGVPHRTTSTSSSDFSNKSRGRDELTTSCHGSIESRPVKKPARNDLASASFHGPVSHARAGPVPKSTRPSTRGPPPPRTKSSDGAEFGLGAATLHGNSVSRIRGGKRRPSDARKSSSTKGGEGDRRMLKRAMSIRNVKRPEEYGPQGGFATAGSALAAASEPPTEASDVERRKAVGRNRMALQRSSSQRQIRDESMTAAAPPSAPANIRAVPEKRDVPMQQPASSRADDQPMEDVDRKHRVRRSNSSDSGHSSQQQRRRSSAPEPRRDLLLLLREQKTVTQTDLQDKENRRLLHFLMYEHKMGMSLKELHRAIRLEQDESRRQRR